MSRPVILCAEDDGPSRALLVAMLSPTYEVLAAASGEEAIETAQRRDPDLVLLDIAMPGLDGFETFEKLRAKVIEESVPVIFLTSIEDAESREKGLEAGAVDYITKPFDRRELSIKVKNHLALYQARKQIEYANAVMAETNRIMAQEMEMACQLQRALLPQTFPESDGIEFAVSYHPCTQAGGDYYEMMNLPDGRIGFAQVDVSGHGVRSAMIGAMFKMSFDSFARAGTSPASVLENINDQMFDMTPDTDFLTVFYGILDPRSGRLVYSNAGHPPPFLYRAADGRIEILNEGGTILGAFAKQPQEEGNTQLTPGDRLLLYTDGITEARSNCSSVALYGERRLRDMFLKHISFPGEDILHGIIEDVRDFQGKTTFDDDVSLMLLSSR